MDSDACILSQTHIHIFTYIDRHIHSDVHGATSSSKPRAWRNSRHESERERAGHERAKPNIISSSSTRFFASASSNRSLPRESAPRTADNDGVEADDNLDARALPFSFCKRALPGVISSIHAPMRSSCASRLRLASARISSISPARCAST